MATAGLKYRDPRKIAKIGRKVTERLNANPAVQWLESPHVQLYVCQNFLSPEDCDFLIDTIDRNARPSTLYQGTEQEGYRTSSSCDVDPDDPEIQRIDEAIADLLGIDTAYSEIMQCQRYEVGQEFKDHHDYFFVDQPYWVHEARNGGQRTWTAMVYLNVPEEGGATHFPALEYSVEARRGMALIWNNMGLDGKPNPNTIHAGTPVIKGSKYIITKWFRINKWRRSSTAKTVAAA